MSTIAVPAIPALPTPPAPEKASSGRLASLDVYRGLIMLALVAEGFGFSVLQNHRGWEWLAAQVDHAAWEGCTFWDLIQPAFTFMVGVAMPFAFARRMSEGAGARGVFGHVVRRALILIVLSNVYSNWGSTHGLRLQLINVLSQIAFGYVICFGVMRLPFRRQVAAAAILLAGYTGLFLLFPGPEGAWSKTGNVGAAIDLHVLGYNYSGYYTTINFVGNAVTILFGCWAGMLLRLERPSRYKLQVLAGCAAASFLLGLGLAAWIPMVKRLWTVSFTFFSAGWVILLLAVLYWIVDVKRVRAWTFPFTVLGVNSLFVYSLSQIGIKRWLDRGLSAFTGNFAFLGDLGAMPQHLVVLAGLWCLCYWLYRRKIYIRI
jgi:predicted acyltransferase